MLSMFSVFAKTIEQEVVIQSTPWSIWRALTDTSAYAKWNALFPSVAGELKAGYSLSVQARITGDTPSLISFRVVSIEHMQELVWTASYSMPGVLDFVYGVAIAPIDRYSTRLTMGLQLQGVLVPMMGKSIERNVGKHLVMTVEHLAATARHHARQGMTIS